jgi:hypothetical protein
MHLLYCDESNLDERAGDFLLYGGVMISSDAAPSLSAEIEKIRVDAKLPPDFRLKFNPKPDHLSHADFISVKQAILKAAANHDVGLLAYAILHDISRNPDEARRFGINTVCYHFDCCLKRQSSSGLVLLDRFNDNGNKIDGHLTEKFSVGLTNMPYANEYRLSNILGLHYTTIGQAHFTSLIDIVIGSLRHAFNTHTRANVGHREGALAMLRLLSPLFVRDNGDDKVSELGMLFSPKAIKSDRYRQQYQAAKEFMAEGGIQLVQEITAERRY